MYYTYNDNALDLGTSGSAVWGIIALVLAIVGGFLVYFLFLKPEIKTKNKFVLWLKDCLDFKSMLIEVILKVSYLILAIYITLISFNSISTSFLVFLLVLVVGNIVLRLMYETFLIIIMIWKNTTEISKNTKK